MEGAYEVAAAALAVRRRDTFDAWKLTDAREGDKVELADVQLYTNERCRLSRPKQRGKAAPDIRAGIPRAEDDFVLFTVPEVALEGGEKAVVRCRGATYTGTCGKSMRYATHNETPFAVRRVV